MKRLLLSAAFALALPGIAMAQAAMTPQEKGLSAPVVAMTQVLAKNAEALKLDEAQQAALKEFMATMPAKRGALEDETVILRSQLHDAILADAPVADREALAAKIGANETTLVMMRSNCVDHWRKVLSPEQFAQLVDMAAAK